MRFVWLLLLAGCDSGAPSGSPDLAPTPDLARPHITAGATDGTVTLKDADFTVDGVGSDVIGSFSLSHGAGTVELGGHPVQAAVYQRQAFPAQNLRLYQALAVESNRLWVLWFYCSSIDDTLGTIYYESTDGVAVTSEPAQGTCQDLSLTSMVAAQFPPLDLPQPELLDGFTIDGPSVQLKGAQPGSVTLGGAPFEVLVFNTVDCRTGCGSPGWTELHALLWDRAGARVCFAIFYLGEADSTHVQLAYSLTLPTLDDPAGNALLPATWSRP